MAVSARVTRHGRDLRCRVKRVVLPCKCIVCGTGLEVGERVVRQGVSAGGRSHARRYCGVCAIGLGLVALVNE